MEDTNLSSTTNLPNTIELSGTSRPEFKIVTDNQRFYRAYNNVTLHLDVKVKDALKRMAFEQETTVSALVSEALAAWMTWLYKARMAEELEEDQVKTEEELKAAQKLLNKMVLSRKIRKRNRALKLQQIRKTQRPADWEERRGRPKGSRNSDLGTGPDGKKMTTRYLPGGLIG